jgi:hypothetical protein
VRVDEEVSDDNEDDDDDDDEVDRAGNGDEGDDDNDAGDGELTESEADEEVSDDSKGEVAIAGSCINPLSKSPEACSDEVGDEDEDDFTCIFKLSKSNPNESLSVEDMESSALF